MLTKAKLGQPVDQFGIADAKTKYSALRTIKPGQVTVIPWKKSFTKCFISDALAPAIYG